MLRLFIDGGPVHTIPLEGRTAAGLAEQLAVIFANGANVLGVQIEESVEHSPAANQTKAKGKKAS